MPAFAINQWKLCLRLVETELAEWLEQKLCGCSIYFYRAGS